MAGHRKRTGKPKRADARVAENRRRVHEAPTGGTQVAAAFDMFRSAAYHDPRRQEVLHEMATLLYQRAVELESAPEN